MTLTLDQIELKCGSHGSTFYGDCCAVELSNLIAAGKVIAPPELLRCDRPLEPAPFSDDHPSISRVIRAYVIALNDAWGDNQRQLLKPYAARILCTATGPKDEETRAWLAVDWLVRVHTPALLRLAGLEEHARALEDLPRIADAALARSAQPTIDAARKDATAVWAAAAAWDAALDAVAAAARNAVAAAALDAVGDAAWAAAATAALGAAEAAASAAALGVAKDMFAEIVSTLQASALELLDEMIAVGGISLRG